jgi:hypothetical protein
MLGVAFSFQPGIVSREGHLRLGDDPDNSYANKTDSHQRREYSEEGHLDCLLNLQRGAIMEPFSAPQVPARHRPLVASGRLLMA